MTHADIYTKFMIEYDKASITSSYPSLTKYEIATLLNKAYLTLIAQKVTGNNSRKAGFESDIKSIEDLKQLICRRTVEPKDPQPSGIVDNECVFDSRKSITLGEGLSATTTKINDVLYIIDFNVLDSTNLYETQLINHAYAKKFRKTANNDPWIQYPVYYLEDTDIHVLHNSDITITGANLMYIKNPTEFTDTFSASTKFELTNTVAEELINLAILFATEITESPRLQTKSSILSLES